jgi:UDP:flavonoid glycosyltransferase YjiC (YdhE family)
MVDRKTLILPLAAALSGLSTVPATEAAASPSPDASTAQAENARKLQPNMLVSTGKDLLGFLVERQADGTLVAQHASHASHASHGSHHSHYSSR